MRTRHTGGGGQLQKAQLWQTDRAMLRVIEYCAVTQVTRMTPLTTACINPY